MKLGGHFHEISPILSWLWQTRPLRDSSINIVNFMNGRFSQWLALMWQCGINVLDMSCGRRNRVNNFFFSLTIAEYFSLILYPYLWLPLCLCLCLWLPLCLCLQLYLSSRSCAMKRALVGSSKMADWFSHSLSQVRILPFFIAINRVSARRTKILGLSRNRLPSAIVTIQKARLLCNISIWLSIKIFSCIR